MKHNENISRTERLERLFQAEIAGFLSRDCAHKFNGILTISRVRISKSLEHGDVYYSVYGGNQNEETLTAVFRELHGDIFSHLSSRLRIKRMPQLRFHLDNTPERAARVETIFKKINQD